MHRRAVFRFSLSFIGLLSLSALAQQLALKPNAATAAEQSPAVRQSAMALIEGALAGTSSLAVPSNRLAIEIRAFPIVCARSDARARALVQQMAGEVAEAANLMTQDPDQNPEYALNGLRNERNGIARGIATCDPELALLFISTTQPHLRSISPDEDSADHSLIVELAAQVALHDPRRALQLAEQQLKGNDDLPPSMIDLLDQVGRKDPQAGAHLFLEIVDHLHRQNLAEDRQALAFAAALLGSEFTRQSETGKTDDLHALAETVTTAALNSDVVESEPYILNDAEAAIKALTPSRSAALFPAVDDEEEAAVAQVSFWQKFNQARSNGDSNQVLALLAHAPEDIRPQAAEKAAWSFANNGDLERTRQIAQSLDPWKRNNMAQTAIRSAALAAGSRADFPSARQLSAQVTDEEWRAILLSDLAIFANGNGKPRLAEDMLGEATALVMNRNASTSAFAAQLRVAQAYLRVKPVQAVPLLERSARQIEQALSAAAQLDGFLPDRHSFEGDELILNQGFLYNSLLEPYARATAELARLDLAAARTLADRLPLPEARLITEVFVASGVLERNDQTRAASNSSDVVPWTVNNR